MTTETNRFTSHEKCKRCRFPYGFHICLAPEILALDGSDTAPKQPVVEEYPRRKPGRASYTMSEEHRESLRIAARERSAANREKNRARDEKIVKDYSENFMSMLEVAEKYDVGKDTVKAILQDFGVKLRHRGWTKASQNLRDNIEEIVKDYEGGMTRDAVAAKWGVAHATLTAELKKAGVKMRPRPGHKPKYTFN